MIIGTKLRILAAIIVLIRSMMSMTKGLRRTSPALMAATSAMVTIAAFVITPKVCEEVKARRVLS